VKKVFLYNAKIREILKTYKEPKVKYQFFLPVKMSEIFYLNSAKSI